MSAAVTEELLAVTRDAEQTLREANTKLHSERVDAAGRVELAAIFSHLAYSFEKVHDALDPAPASPPNYGTDEGDATIAPEDPTKALLRSAYQLAAVVIDSALQEDDITAVDRDDLRAAQRVLRELGGQR